MNLLTKYGWNQSQENFYTSLRTNLLPGRVITISGFKYTLITAKGELDSELSGKLLFDHENEMLPKVGDWVLFMDYESIGYIVELIPRTNALSRKCPGSKSQRQVFAANVDTALIMQGVDRDFNLMRLERYIFQVLSCGIKPVVVLNKSDLAEDPALFVEEIHRLGRECPIFPCSTLQGQGMDAIIQEVFRPGFTFILIGSSGVGKSSFLNALMHDRIQKTGSLSDSNHKGRHTTTKRELFIIPNGSIIIDTPGMREFGVTSEETSDTNVFPAIQQLAHDCRYSDCSHTIENGCAVLAAVHNGRLDALIYESYVKLIKEQQRFQITAEERKRIGKRMGKMTREAADYRKKYKY